MNTTLKPKMKAAEFSMSFRSTRASWDFNSSTPVPEINDTYPGTSGRTHGERKEISPAKNAAMGSGTLYFFNLLPGLVHQKMRYAVPEHPQSWRFMGQAAVTRKKEEEA